MKSKEEILGDYNETEFLAKCQLDFKFFCERLLGFDIQPFHMEWFNMVENNQRTAILAPTGFGKTTILGISYPLWIAFTRTKKEVLVISNSLNQSTRILQHIRDHIENNPLLRTLKPKDANQRWSKKEIVTSSHCKIMCRPYSINIKGEHVDYILMDESASYDDPDIYFDYIVPRAASRGGTICLISTPESTTDLMGIIESKGLDYEFGKYPAIQDGESIWPDRFPLEKLEKFRRELGEQYFEKNYMCNPRAESEKSIYKLEDIQAGFDYSRGFTSQTDGGFTLVSCDFAISDHSTADYDAYIVLEKVDDKIILKHIEKHRGVRTPVKVKNIRRLVDEYEPLRVIIDKENIGATMVDSLRAEGISVIPQDFHSQSRTAMLMTMKNVLDAHRLVIPRKESDGYAIDMTNELIEQLINIVESTNPISGRKQYVSNTAHNDLAMSLAMGVFHANKIKSGSTKGIMGSLRG
ncbi:MAG: terminase large subunit domain-containing protein [archaeon]